MFLQKFYLEYRKSISHFLYGKPGVPIEIPASMDAWKSAKSTKLDAVVRVCVHLLSDDEAPHITPSDASMEMVIPPHVPSPDAKKTRKILVFQDFRSMTPLLVAVSTLHIEDD